MEPTTSIHRMVFDYGTGMGVFWTVQPSHTGCAELEAVSRLFELSLNCPDSTMGPTFDLVVIECIEVISFPIQEILAAETHDLLLYGPYGTEESDTVASIVRWTDTNEVLPDLPLDYYQWPDDINNLNGILIGPDQVALYLRRAKKS